jgi:hypothetical protein
MKLPRIGPPDLGAITFSVSVACCNKRQSELVYNYFLGANNNIWMRRLSARPIGIDHLIGTGNPASERHWLRNDPQAENCR